MTVAMRSHAAHVPAHLTRVRRRHLCHHVLVQRSHLRHFGVLRVEHRLSFTTRKRGVEFACDRARIGACGDREAADQPRE